MTSPATLGVPTTRIGFVSGPLQHRPVSGAIYDVLTYDGRAYTDLVFVETTPQRRAYFSRDGYAVATIEEVFQYQLNALPNHE